MDFKELIEDARNVKLVSVVNIWEISIKAGIGKLPLDITIKDLVKKIRFQILGIDLEHVIQLDNLPDNHKDPFDRMLVCQAMVEGCEILTTDGKIQKYFR